jgi:hypothetical protein
MLSKVQASTVADVILARRSERSKPPMKRNPFLFSAIVSFFLFVVVEVGTRDLGHEMTYFRTLSQPQSVCVRYMLLFIAVCLFVAAASRNRRFRTAR